MSEDVEFLPREDILSFEEILRLVRAFAGLGVSTVRLTGGEPLVRKDLASLVAQIRAVEGISEVTLTTNGSLLSRYAKPLRKAGIDRLNISLDTLNREKFAEITRRDRLEDVLAGIQAARKEGFKRIRINSVIMRGLNDDEIIPLTDYALGNDLDISFIEEMPLGEVGYDRQVTFISSDEIREIIGTRYRLSSTDYQTGGPARYWSADGYQGLVSFISPHSHNFCGDCNRVRLTASGRLLLCLGNEHSKDLLAELRSGCSDEEIRQSLIDALRLKPERHDFDLGEEVQILRFMSHTGG